jgi:hypothetical protein
MRSSFFDPPIEDYNMNMTAHFSGGLDRKEINPHGSQNLNMMGSHVAGLRMSKDLINSKKKKRRRN